MVRSGPQSAQWGSGRSRTVRKLDASASQISGELKFGRVKNCHIRSGRPRLGMMAAPPTSTQTTDVPSAILTSGARQLAPVRRSTAEICIMNADGTNVTKLTHNKLGEGFPAWQPVPSL